MTFQMKKRRFCDECQVCRDTSAMHTLARNKETLEFPPSFLQQTYLHIFDGLIHNLFGILEVLENTVDIGLGHTCESIKDIHLKCRI